LYGRIDLWRMSRFTQSLQSGGLRMNDLVDPIICEQDFQ
jgi:hypothetical protein